MRPVRLDLDGFASFRDPTTVDFADAEYFALVGPTGSGKSTIVDALTFALYGSAPRWGSATSIQYALAPSANRCTVRLIFDVAGRRYVVAREVRRSGTQISQKNTSLERFADPAATGAPDADEATEILAGDPRAIRDRVAELLGLDLAEFCTCVVLPQGEFQTFLKASVTERQNILLKLLGARHYDAIGKLAGRRAADASVRVEALTAQLGEYVDATAEHESAARAREADLASLQTRVEESATMIATRAEAAAAVETRTADLSAQIELLDAVTPPASLAELRARSGAVESAYVDVSRRERAVRTAAAAAEQALADGPDREHLQQTLCWRDEWNTEWARRPAVEARAEAAGVARRTAVDQATAVETALHERQLHHREASARRDTAHATQGTLLARIELLREVRTPDGVVELGERTARAASARAAAVLTRQTAEVALNEARSGLDVLPERSALDALRRTIEAYRAASAHLGALDAKRRELTEAVESATAAVSDRTDERDAAVAAFDALRTRSVAADLRPQLRVGDACPVCDQTVATIPPPTAVPLLDSARATRAEAEDRLVVAVTRRHELITALAAVRAQLDEATDTTATLDRTLACELPDNPSGAHRDPVRDRTSHDARAAERETAAQRQRQAAAAADDAKAALEEADRRSSGLARESQLAWAELHTARGALVPAGAPLLSSSDLAAAWSALTGWAAGLADQLSAELPGVDGALRAADEAVHEATAELARAVETDRAAARELTVATVDEQQAVSERQRLSGRLRELDGLLADRPESVEAARLLAECDRLAMSVRAARTAAQEAAAARQCAEESRDAVRVVQQQARIALHRVRDPLIGLGAPPVDDSDLTLAWTLVVEWSAGAAAQRRAEASRLQAQARKLGEQLPADVADLVELLTAHGLVVADGPSDLDPIRPDLARQITRVPSLVLVEREGARARTAEIVRRRTAADKLRATIAADTETRQVSAELQRLMSSRRFPQWLADAALDTLVADASASLMRLSSGQFDLTHERGEFFVVDHADADSRRSVRTLSGGETFQASLALALALSEQLSTLAAGGRTTLDSIFLDEGFGTLDPDALEIVAGTLENLAQEDRMVGVITHVTALAERVPVRYDVSRDSRTSTVVRVGP